MSGLRLWMIVLWVLAMASPVQAHTTLPTKAEPPAGVAAAQSPAQVRLTFSEELQSGADSWVRVTDASGKLVDKGGGGVDLNDASHAVLLVTLPGLPQGVYKVMWKIKLLDGDVSQGEYFFGVGNVTVPTPAAVKAEAGEDAAASPLGWILLAGLVVVAGGLGVVLLRRRKG